MKKNIYEILSRRLSKKSPQNIAVILIILFSMSIVIAILAGALAGWAFGNPVLGAIVAFALLLLYVLLRQVAKR
jgi:O-antigen/teichoic acid export membrane protein